MTLTAVTLTVVGGGGLIMLAATWAAAARTHDIGYGGEIEP